MKQRTRTEYSVMNTSVAFVSQIIAIFMGFITRVVFTRTLSEGYVGINGLFTDILGILSLSEMGVGVAITYALYDPIARNDIKKQQILMRMFRSFYRMTAAFVLSVGLLIVPFLDFLMKDRPDVDHLILIYMLYLGNSVLSYLMIYKNTLVEAHQMNYIRVLNQSIFLLLQNVCQIIVLVTTKNFILYLIIAVICTVAANVTMSRKAEKLFPYLKETCHEKLPAGERQELNRNIKALLIHRLGNVAVNNTDNLILSSFVSVVSAGIYSNYYLVIGSIRQVLDQAFQGVTASVGNLGVTEDKEKVKQVFDELFFIGQWMYGLAGVCLFEMLNPFVELAFGKQYLFTRDIVLVLCVNFFVNGMRRSVLIFKESVGLFWYDRYKALVEAAVNLVVSIWMVSQWGVIGVFIGTFVSMAVASVWIEPYVIYKYRFHESSLPFFFRYLVNTAVMAGVWWGTDFLCGLVDSSAFVNLIFRLVVCAIVPNLLLCLVYCRTREWNVMAGLLKKMIGKFI